MEYGTQIMSPGLLPLKQPHKGPRGTNINSRAASSSAPLPRLRHSLVKVQHKGANLLVPLRRPRLASRTNRPKHQNGPHLCATLPTAPETRCPSVSVLSFTSLSGFRPGGNPFLAIQIGAPKLAASRCLTESNTNKLNPPTFGHSPRLMRLERPLGLRWSCWKVT